ncbi:MAG: ribosome silencing factor [Proteobacteria bacterium]|nr:ribosome silencing factor [Pseudomonadota bacterium]
MEAKELALAIAEVALDKLAESLDIIDVGGKVDYTNFVVICSARSQRHVDAIVSGVETALKKQDIYALGIEGRQSSQWILMDYNDVVLHVFEDERRGFYDLDSLWIDAKRVPLRKAAGAE